MDESEIMLAAQRMMRLHGAHAAPAAAERAAKMRQQNNIEGFHAWSRIKDAISDLERRERGAPGTT